jgi:tetratricopeptide (TPR) repeat protein
MIRKKLLFGILILLLTEGLTVIFAQGRPTSQEELIKIGVSFYSEGKYSEAASILQLASSSPEALYWLSLAELSSGNFDKSLTCLETLEKTGPSGRWSEEVFYHRGRCFYYLGRYDEAIVSLQTFSGSLSDSDLRKASSYYWQGESLLALGQLDKAADAFSTVVEKYPTSSKYEAANYRLSIINQKRIETELLAILKWSHEESLKSMEEYQEREKNYELAIASYQKRLGELAAISGEDAGLPVSGESSAYYQQQIMAADQKIAELETSLAEANAAFLTAQGENPADSGQPGTQEQNAKLEQLKAAALELSNTLRRKLEELEK